jgi:hypothetical protein
MSTQGLTEHRPMQAAARPSMQVVLAMIGSICGTLLTGALDTSPTVRLIGAVLGAAIPTLIGYAGPYYHLRASVGIAATAVALFVTYGGFTLLDFAADRPKTFPLPSALPQPDQGSSPSVHRFEDRLGIRVTPTVLRCSSDRCEEPVKIESTGEELLLISTIEFDGMAASEFRHDGQCENQSLRKGEDCRLSVSFAPLGSGTRRARLVIHQNFSGDPTYVAVEGEGSAVPSIGDLVPSPDDVECVHQRAGATINGEQKDALQIIFALRLDGASPDELPGLVLVTARSNIGPAASAAGSVGDGRVAALPLEPDDYGQTHIITVSVDPKNEVPEINEDNNQLTVTVGLPEQPASAQSLPCLADQG